VARPRSGAGDEESEKIRNKIVTGVTPDQIVEVVNASIGSSAPHINVVIRERPGKNPVEAGEPERELRPMPLN
jgi:hypothetical protein